MEQNVKREKNEGGLQQLHRKRRKREASSHHQCQPNDNEEDSSSNRSNEEEAASSSLIDGTITVYRQDRPYTLSYRIYNGVSSLSSDISDGSSDDNGISSSSSVSSYAPLIVLHGGPGLPSQYLYSLVDLIPSKRPIIFYDQLGCGRSSEPDDVNEYSIAQSVDDLQTLIQKLNLRHFHLYGHSYGGVLAYEYIKRIAEEENTFDEKTSTSNHTSSNNSNGIKHQNPKCLSVILSNTPTSFGLSNSEWERLLKDECNSNDDLFFKTNQCRTESVPTPLLDAFQNAGKIWIGTDVVSDYIASPPSFTVSKKGDGGESKRIFPPALLVKGQYDFVTDACTEGWSDIFSQSDHGSGIKEMTMEGCAHYCHFEDGQELYGSIVESFCLENE